LRALLDVVDCVMSAIALPFSTVERALARLVGYRWQSSR
jgi:hypothetical protein